MRLLKAIRYTALPALALLLAACSSSSAAGWTYAPLGPSPNASAAAPSSAPGSPSGSGGPGISVQTTSDQPIAFNPNTITVTAGSTVTITYTNNSSLPHDINFFNGSDNNAPSLGATTVASGPNNTQTVTFTAPTTPGTYFFWCDVHQQAMKGTWTVQ